MVIKIHTPWNKNRIIGQKKPLQISHIWGIRIRLELEGRTRDLALFNLGLDSKLRGFRCCLRTFSSATYACRSTKTGSPVQFEITPNTRESIMAWVNKAGLRASDYLFKSRIHDAEHMSTRQYNRIFHGWIEKLGLDTSLYSTHSMRRTKPYLIYKKTKNLLIVQLLLGHKKLESTVRYLGIEVDDALEISESIEV